MKSKLTILFSTISLFLMFFMLFGCSAPGISSPDSSSAAGKGSLAVSINESVSKSEAPAVGGPEENILPGISMDPVSYIISGNGPDGAGFSTPTTGASVIINDLAFGEWTITVEAFNADGTVIGTGTSTTTVQTNTTALLNISVYPIDGLGTLDLSLTWTESDVNTPQVESTLTPSSGTARTLDFTVGSSSATFSTEDVATGYHTLVLKLLDNGILTMGAVDVVRIVADNTTSGSFTFNQINQATGSIDVGITPEMGDPLTLAISGAAETKPENKTMTLSASATDYTGNVSYVWYVNGNATDTGETFDFDDSWAQGYYRIDVTGYNTDGSRAGSENVLIEVDQPMYPINLSSSYIYSETVTGGGSVIVGGTLSGNDETFTAQVDGVVVSEAQLGDTVVLTASLNVNRQVSLTATGPGSTLFFEEVIGTDGGTYSFTMPNYEVDIMGTFEPNPGAITVSVEGTLANGNDQLISDLSEAVVGDTVTLTVELDDDHEMVLSTSDGTVLSTETVRDDNTTVTFTMPEGDIHITGQIEERAHYISLNNEVEGTVECERWVRPGLTVSVSYSKETVPYAPSYDILLDETLLVQGIPTGISGTTSFTMPNNDVTLSFEWNN